MLNLCLYPGLFSKQFPEVNGRQAQDREGSSPAASPACTVLDCSCCHCCCLFLSRHCPSPWALLTSQYTSAVNTMLELSATWKLNDQKLHPLQTGQWSGEARKLSCSHPPNGNEQQCDDDSHIPTSYPSSVDTDIKNALAIIAIIFWNWAILQHLLKTKKLLH